MSTGFHTESVSAKLGVLKKKLRTVLHTTKFCSICYESNDNFKHLDQQTFVETWNGTTLMTLRNIVDEIFYQAPSIISNNFICQTCENECLQTFKFVKKTKSMSELVNFYTQQLVEEMDIFSQMESNDEIKDSAKAVIILESPYVQQYKEEYGILNDGSYSSCGELESIEEKCCLTEFKCDYCAKVFDTKQKIAVHIRKMHLNKNCSSNKKIKLHPCSECDTENCVHRKYLLQFDNPKNNGSKKCADCDYICYTKSQLINHVNKVHLGMYTVCQICAIPLYSKVTYSSHMRQFHSTYHKCPYCDYKLIDKQKLEIHIEECKKHERFYKCSTCPASFDTKIKFNDHNKKHQDTFACNQCSRIFYSEKSLKKHENMHKNNTVSKQLSSYDCSICNKSFKARRERDTHVLCHDQKEKHCCNICNKEFKTAQRYYWHIKQPRHLLKINPDTVLTHQCKDCNYQTRDRQCLETHINKHHLNITPYECTRCQKKFSSSVNLRQHYHTHESIKKWQCELCGNSFCAKSALQKHMRLHTGERPYKCHVCDEKFISASMRTVHVHKEHLNVKESCPLCDAIFTTKSNLRFHIKKYHWHVKGESFDLKKVEGLTEEHYKIFDDRRAFNKCK